MTMLDRMRRHKNWLKWSLAIVVLAFVIFYIPDFLSTTDAGAAPRDVLAEVEGHEITVGEFRRIYDAQLQSYRAAYGGSVNEQLLRQLGMDQQILQQLVDEQAALAEARRLGLSATDAEVRARVLAMPAFQDNGAFIGEARYRQMLRLQRPPMTPAEFEAGLRRGIIVEKLRAALTDWITVSDAEVEQEYRQRNEKVKLAVVAIMADQLRDKVTVTDGDVSAHFEAHKDEFKIGEKRKVRHLLIDTNALRSRVAVAPQEVERSYNDNLQQYSTPEQVRASHILLKTEGKDEAAVRKEAEAILAKLKAGADFAELAKKRSEDEASAQLGGDLDFFGRGRMVPEFDQAAFTLEPGALSDPVKTQFGFHIIKVVDKKPALTRPLDEVREQITDQLKFERAQRQAADLAALMADEIDDPGDFDRVARTRGLKVQESGFFSREEPIVGLGFSPEASAEAFRLKEGEVGSAQTPQGFAFMTLVGRQDAYVPKLEEVKDRVREAVIKEKAAALAKERAAELAPALKNAKDLEAAVKAAGFEPKTTELIPRGSPIVDIGVSPEIDAVAFSLPIGGVSDPIATDTATAIVRVVERDEVTPEEFEAAKETARGDVLAERRSRFFSSYMSKAKERMTIAINRDTWRRVTS